MKNLISKCCNEKLIWVSFDKVNGICSKCNDICEVIEPKEEKCDYCEGLGFRTESIENDIGGGDIEQIECPKCKGTGIKGGKPKEEKDEVKVGIDWATGKDKTVEQIIKTPTPNDKIEEVKKQFYKQLT
jgi:hypothetical protein